MPDASTKACFRCDRLFTALRRKHHCRFCGMIFCAACSSQKVIIASGQQPVRACVQCSSALTRSASPNISLFEPLPLVGPLGLEESLRSPSISSFASSFSSVSVLRSVAQDCDTSMDSLLEDLACSGHCDFDEACAHFLQKHLHTCVTAAGLQEHWCKPLADLITEAVHKVQAFTRIRDDSMNVTRYLKIVKVKWKDHSLTRFLSGVAFYHSLANRRMQSQISSPSLLLLETACSAAQDQRLVSMDTLLQQDEAYSTLFLRKVLLLSPALVLVERGMVERAVTELAASNITAFLHVERSTLELLARVARAKLLASVDQAASARRTVLGQCEDFTMRSVGERTLVLLKTGESACLGGSLIISSPDVEELRKLKPLLRSLIVSCRSALLEAELLQTLGMQATPSTMLDHHCSSASFLYFTACKLPCTSPQRLDVQFYLDGDSPLGLKLLRFCQQAGENCVCGEPLSGHTHTFLRKGGSVQLTKRLLTEDPQTVEEKDPIYVRVLCKKCGEAASSFTLTNFAWEYSFYKFISNFFVPVKRTHKHHPCPCDFFRDYVFLFTVQNVELQVAYHAKSTRSLRSLTYDHSTEELFTSLKFKGLIDLKAAGSEVVTSLQTSVARLEGDLDSQVQWKQDLRQAREDMESTLQGVVALEEEDLKDFLAIEKHRRALFFAVCKVKSLLENVSTALSSVDVRSLPSKEDCESPSLDPNQSLSLSSSRFLHPKATSKKLDPLLRSRNFEYLQRGALTLPLCAGGACVPVEEEDCLSILAYALSSETYDREMLPSTHTKETLASELLAADFRHLQISFSTYEDSDLVQAENRTELQQLYGPHLTFRVTVYYSRQFLALQTCFLSQTAFIQSLCRSLAREEKEVLSHDQRFKAQLVEEKSFAMFLNLAPNYFRYLYKCIYTDMPSLLLRTLGAYRVSIKKAGHKQVEWVLLTENLTYGVEKLCGLYSLQGRLVEKGRDWAFFEDMGKTPMCLDVDSKKLLDVAVWNDSRFLSKQNVIDYALQLVVGATEIRAGISDYSQQYTLDKAVESRFRALACQDEEVSSEDYRARFRKRVSEDYFVGVES